MVSAFNVCRLSANILAESEFQRDISVYKT